MICGLVEKPCEISPIGIPLDGTKNELFLSLKLRTGNQMFIFKEKMLNNHKVKKAIIDLPFTILGVDSFRNCPKLWKVQLPETIQIIHGAAIVNCPRLRTMNLDNIVEIKITKFFLGIPLKLRNVNLQSLKKADIYHLSRFWGIKFPNTFIYITNNYGMAVEGELEEEGLEDMIISTREIKNDYKAMGYRRK